MLRHGLATLALMGVALTIPDQNFAEAATFRPAFTGGPFRIVVPSFGRHLSGRRGPHGIGPIHGRTISTTGVRHPVRQANPGHPAVRTAAEGPRHFRVLRYRRVGNSLYPVTVGSDASFYGMPYDPSDDIPVYAPPVLGSADLTVPPSALSLRAPLPDEPIGCRAEHVRVPSASGAGEREVTIVRC
jgi:hypothetical protein